MGWREKEAANLAGKKVLMVGAGGIGCELLKNIVLAGFRDIHVIDLDTIDVSNLNRQFLFRREHVGKSKAEVATAAGLRIAPDAEVKIVFDHDSIFSEQFNYEFFKQFEFVLNALDNKAARNHVNRMCMATRVPLIDGGTAGYLGQVHTMMRGATECYECVPKNENKKTFPGCTIRNTPSEHIHCTVWSKHVFNQLFGEVDIDDDVSPDMEDEEANEKKTADNAENGMEMGDGPKEEEEGGDAKEEEGEGEPKEKPSNTRVMAEESGYDAEKIFNKLFVDDIHYLLKMANLWKERRAPVPQPFGELATENPGGSAISTAAQMDPAQRVWTPSENGEEFRKAVEELRDRKAATSDGILSWDKDDDAAMRFVAACANIRAVIFGIPPKSLFEIKSMAGNIIPAIATTNAIIAGIMTVDALKIAAGHAAKVASSILLPAPNHRGMVVIAQPPEKPNPSCYTCSAKREVTVRVNVEKMTVETLRDKVLMGALGVAEPDVMEATTSKVILSSEEGETDGLLADSLSLHGLSMGGRLLVEDFDSGAEMRLVVLQAAAFDGLTFEIVSDEKPEVKEEEEMAEQMEDASIGKKRKTMDEHEFQSKKARLEEGEEA